MECGCFLQCITIYKHGWAATVPLVGGDNVIEIRAQDASGNADISTVTINAPAVPTPPDTVQPTVLSTGPFNGQVNVSVSALIQAAFSEEMNVATLTPATFTLRDSGGNAVGGIISVSGLTATFDPAVDLQFATSYTATISTEARDLAGNSLAMPFEWTFTTASVPDTTPPLLNATSPVNGAACVPTESDVTATFSETMSGNSVKADTFFLRDGMGNLIDAYVGLDARRGAVLHPSSPLANTVTYTATVTRGVMDLAGNSLAAGHSWTFTTENAGAGTWAATQTAGAPSPRWAHTAVWTGTEMIIWGGDGFKNDGGRYQPGSNTWVPVSNVGAPQARGWHVAVWTGSKMIIWGGVTQGAYLNSGAIYDPQTDSWTSMSTVGAPSPRQGPIAVWTGTEMIVWGGGTEAGTWGDGARYDPSTNSWSPIANTGAPSVPFIHPPVWTGSAMIVWGVDGAMYFPASDTWVPMSVTGAPAARHSTSAVWMGSEMIVWGGMKLGTTGEVEDFLNTGARFNPNSNSWQPISSQCAPLPRGGAVGVWTGSEMIVWGGGIANMFAYQIGGRYNTNTDSWQPTSGPAAPVGRVGATAVWTGTELIVWGGRDLLGGLLNSGGRYRP
jgi:N-acetylneuraminic acid mutarotase